MGKLSSLNTVLSSLGSSNQADLVEVEILVKGTVSILMIPVCLNVSENRTTYLEST